jgi:hypothetical protein
MRKLIGDRGLETFQKSHYYFYFTVINTRRDKNLKASALSRSRSSRSLLSRPPALASQLLILVTAVVLLAAATMASSATAAPTSLGFSPSPGFNTSPQLVIDGTRRDFGEVFIGEELEQVFTVRNVGTAPLELANKMLTEQSPARKPAAASSKVSYSSEVSYKAASNYLRPAALIKRLAAPT